jgi:hypothetical protein
LCTSRPRRRLERGMAVLTTPCPARLHHPPPAFPDRLALDAPVSLAWLAPRVGTAAPGTCPRAPCRWGAAWRPLERQPRRVLRRPGAAATGAALRPDVHHPAGLGFARTADDPSLGTATQHTAARPPGGDVLEPPCVQAMLEESLGQHGRTAPAWRRPLVGVPQRSRLPPARVPPLAHQSAYASLTDALRDTLPQGAPGPVGAHSTDLRLDSPGAGQRSPLLPPLLPRLLGTGALPEALGAGRHIRCADGCQAPPPRPLAQLGLDAGLPSWPLLPIVLLDPSPRDWRCQRPMVTAPCRPVPQGVVQGLSRRRGRPLGSPRGTLLARQPLGFQQEGLVAHVPPVVAHPLWRALCLGRHALEWPGDGW